MDLFFKYDDMCFFGFECLSGFICFDCCGLVNDWRFLMMLCFLFLNFCILILSDLVLLLWIVSVLVFNHSYTSWWNVSWDFNGVMCFNTTFLRVCSSKHRHMTRFYNLYMFNNVVRKWICFLKMMTAVFLFLNGRLVLFVSMCIYF